jgi:hypothetical protein
MSHIDGKVLIYGCIRVAVKAKFLSDGRNYFTGEHGLSYANVSHIAGLNASRVTGVIFCKDFNNQLLNTIDIAFDIVGTEGQWGVIIGQGRVNQPKLIFKRDTGIEFEDVVHSVYIDLNSYVETSLTG